MTSLFYNTVLLPDNFFSSIQVDEFMDKIWNITDNVAKYYIKQKQLDTVMYPEVIQFGDYSFNQVSIVYDKVNNNFLWFTFYVDSMCCCGDEIFTDDDLQYYGQVILDRMEILTLEELFKKV